MIAQRTIISGSAGQIFTIFSLNESVLRADDRSGLLFLISQGLATSLDSRDVAIATNLWKNGKLPSFLTLAFRNGMEYHYLNMRMNSVNHAYF